MKHVHEWKTNYLTINHVDCASGMSCNCGKTLSQDEVEDLLNEKGHWWSYLMATPIVLFGTIVIAHSELFN